ncbi:hypothetical protein DFH09DRAFT_1106274 [Mycena vulgaris]|nr:hypothetical protein DFH09DRAFT_1106274 [Mycena vulgaris]
MQPDGQPPTGRTGSGHGVFARLGRRINKFFTMPATTTTTIHEALRDSISPHLLNLRCNAESYEIAHLAYEATVVSVTFIRYQIPSTVQIPTDTPQTRIVERHSQMQHPAFHNKTITLLLERLAKAGGSPSSSASSSGSTASISTEAADTLIISTEKSEAELSPRRHGVAKTLTFPHRAPNFGEILALARLVSNEYRTYSLTNHCCIFYSLAVYNALETEFDAKSEKGPDYYNQALPAILTFLNRYSADFQVVVAAFDAVRSKLRGQVELLRSKEAEADVVRALREQIAALEAAQSPFDGAERVTHNSVLEVLKSALPGLEMEIWSRHDDPGGYTVRADRKRETLGDDEGDDGDGVNELENAAPDPDEPPKPDQCFHSAPPFNGRIKLLHKMKHQPAKRLRLAETLDG